jgi:hypothetical protein
LEDTERRFGKAPLNAFARPDGVFFKLTITLASPDDFAELCLCILELASSVLLIVRGLRGIGKDLVDGDTDLWWDSLAA